MPHTIDSPSLEPACAAQGDPLLDTHAMHQAAIAAAQSGDAARALVLFDEVLSVQSQMYQAWSNRGNVLDDLGRVDEALASYDRALQIYPDYEAAKQNRLAVVQKLANAAFSEGLARHDINDLEVALVSYERALSIYPEHRAANLNAALVLEDLGRLEEAVARWLLSEKLQPGYATGLHRAANILNVELNQQPEALACYDHVLALDPSNTSVRWDRSYSLLALGRYREGWQDYDLRASPQVPNWFDFPQPKWRGEPLAGKRILLWSEQGFGDALQFCRYALTVRSLGASVFFLAHPRMRRLLEISFAAHDIRIIESSAQATPFDYHCPLLSLPVGCKTHSVEEIPIQQPYLFADATDRQLWQTRLAKAHGTSQCRIGLVWAGGHRPDNLSAQEIDKQRSLLLSQFEALGAVSKQTNSQFFSLQLGGPEKQIAEQESQGWGGPALIDYTHDLHDWADTAALIANLDLVIACDTAVAHLAAALGKPTWILSRYNSCWRWLLDRDDSPWYPTVRLFRQPKRGDWASVMQQVAQALSTFANKSAQ